MADLSYLNESVDDTILDSSKRIESLRPEDLSKVMSELRPLRQTSNSKAKSHARRYGQSSRKVMFK